MQNKLQIYQRIYEYNEAVNCIIMESFKNLRENYGINYFYYNKFVKGFSLFLCSELKFVRYVLENDLFASKYPTFQNVIKGIAKTDVRKFIWTGTPPDKVHQVLYDYDIWNGYTIYESSDECLEVWGFGTNKSSTNMINFYVNHEYLLREHIFKFKDKCSKLLQDSNNFLLIPSSLKVNDNQYKRTSESNNNIRKYFLTPSLSLSKRQMECVLASIKGKTAKEIAIDFGLSHRSIEAYLENLKFRIGCSTRKEMIERLFEFESLRSLLFKK